MCLATLSVWAQEAPQQGARVPQVREFRMPPRVGIQGQRPLSLEEALMMALENNRDIDISRIDQQRAKYNITSAEGVYDPRIGGVASFQKNVVPVASSLGGSTTGAVTNKNSIVDPQLTGAIAPFGSSYQVDFSNSRTTTNNTFTQLNPQYPTALTFSYTQPLLRGFRYDDNRRRVAIAKKNKSLTDEQFRQRVMEIITTTEQAYWDLVYTYGNLGVQLEAVQIGLDQDASNRRQQEQGLLAPIDVVAAQRQLATFEQAAYTAQEALTIAENVLKQLILADRGDPIWSLSLVPTTAVDVDTPLLPLDDAINEALSNRPELAQLRITRDINQTDNKYFREQVKPQVDAIISHSSAGLAGTQLPAAPNPFTSGLTALTNQVNQLSTIAGIPALPTTGGGTTAGVPPILVGGYGQSIQNVFSNNFPTTQVQLRVSFPIRNRTAEANLGSNLAEAKRIRDQQQQTEQFIEANVRNSMQAMDLAKARMQASEVARVSAEQQYESEQRQFRAGTSTLFLVQQRQNDMITARSQEQFAQAALSKAIAAFELSTARTLTVHQIDIK